MRAFTLAESLIVMAVIGIIAALVLPNLTQNTSESETVAKLNKAYFIVDTAFNNIMSEAGGDLSKVFVGISSQADRNTKLKTELTKQLKLSNATCDNGAKCVGNSSIDGSNDYIRLLITGGTGIAVKATEDSSGTVVVDIDGGNKGYNTDGYDIFSFTFNNNGLTPNGAYDDNVCVKNGTICQACSAWVIENKNMDYLRCGSSLSWTGSRTCE